MVQAKGKGLMQTYWVRPRSKDFTVSNSSMHSSFRGGDSAQGHSERPEEAEPNLHTQLLDIDEQEESVVPIVTTIFGTDMEFDREVEI